MRTNAGAHGAADDGDIQAAVLLADSRLQPIRVLLGIRRHNDYGHDGVMDVILPKRLDQRLERLLATAVDAQKGQRPRQVKGELRLDIELARQLGGGCVRPQQGHRGCPA